MSPELGTPGAPTETAPPETAPPRGGPDGHTGRQVGSGVGWSLVNTLVSRLGSFLAEKPRDEFIISTKVGRLLVPTPDRAAERSHDGTIRRFA